MSSSFFIYNVMLADSLRRLDLEKFYIKETGVRRAYDSFSLSTRLNYVGGILALAQSMGGQDDLFMPELAATSFVSSAKTLQDDFRNRISHTAAASEGQQNRLMAEYQPVVEGMLEELAFLANYRLARIPLLYYKKGQLVRRMELYRGTAPSLVEEPLSATEMVAADHEHIVLLNLDGEVLDLYPMCQRVADASTRHDTHMCFMKQRKLNEKLLYGESVQGAFDVQLAGYDDFDALQAPLTKAPVN